MNRRSFLTTGLAAGMASPALAAGESQACAPARGTGDLGLIIERANEPLGLVTAARFAEPNYYDVLGVTVTVRLQEAGKTMIRANAIYNSKPIEDPKVYQNFFAAVERSLFLVKD